VGGLLAELESQSPTVSLSLHPPSPPPHSTGTHTSSITTISVNRAFVLQWLTAIQHCDWTFDPFAQQREWEPIVSNEMAVSRVIPNA